MDNHLHTAGPWKIFRQHNPKPEYTTTWHLDSDTRKHMAILTVYDLNSSPAWRELNPDKVAEYNETMIEVEANARLIAASPTMFDALEKIIESGCLSDAMLFVAKAAIYKANSSSVKISS
jgi:hypothetical protein